MYPETIKTNIEKSCAQLHISSPEKIIFDTESAEYGACTLCINGSSVLFRIAKVTPKKRGLFVTLWRRSEQGTIEPLTVDTCPDLVLIQAQNESQWGLFIFPKAILIRQGILQSKDKKGKLAFRIYPTWDRDLNNSATKTQRWQKHYFYDENTKDNTNLEIEQALKQLKNTTDETYPAN